MSTSVHTLRGQNTCLICHESLELMLYFGKGFRSFHTGNMGSLGQRASKLKLEFSRKSAASDISAELCASALGSNSN